MTTMPLSDRTGAAQAETEFQTFALRVLSILIFGGFAIVATIMAFLAFWPAGFVLAMFLAWRGFGTVSRFVPPASLAEGLAPVAPVARSSGNASFDAYRHDMLNRLEQEQKSFEDFLTRLRDAKDQREFDRFMDDRAARDTDTPPA